MKTLKTLRMKILAFALIVQVLALAFSASAHTPAMNGMYSDCEDIDQYFGTDPMISCFEAGLNTGNTVQILDSENNLVVAGTDSDGDIIKYEQMSDLVTEISGVKYYRLSF